MTSRKRVLQALAFENTDRAPRDLGAMRSTGISAFAYPKLVAALDLPPRRPRVHDTGQMLALPEPDVLDALGCDVATVDGGVSSAFEEPEKWTDYDFGGRLPARVLNRDAFEDRPDGAVVQTNGSSMPPSSHVFNAEHSGQPLLDLDQPLPLFDLEEHARRLEGRQITPEQVQRTVDMVRRVRESTDRAVFLADHCGTGIGIGGYCGIGIYPIICKLEPQFVREFHEIQIEHAIRNARILIPAVRDYVDVVLATADDWGTQRSLIASPETYRTLFMPYYRRYNDEVHRLAPNVKVFMHNCGAIYPLLDLIAESGFDVLNPVQWSAGGHSFREWKDVVRGRMTLWGGGVDTQHTLPHGTVADVEREVTEVVRYCREDGGFIFTNIHNLLAEVPPEKVIAMYRAAGEA